MSSTDRPTPRDPIEARMPMDESGHYLALGEQLIGHGMVTGVRWPIGVCLSCGSRVVNLDTGEGHGEHRTPRDLIEAPATYQPDDRSMLGEPPWRPDDPVLQAWEAAHGHDVRLDCDPERCRPAWGAALEQARDEGRQEAVPDPKVLRLALLDLAGLDYAYDARLDSGEYGSLERPYEFADRIIEAYRRVARHGRSSDPTEDER